ncbi:hypothetical protein [Nonomuraea jabiensis]|uniref:Uncharacterized protein n=1 Tax=Nonomuraea jabiensis TaxID=882448 RepID=A0A7W9L7N9_9ACTN|nr:hypothetical protein [Nonomuraea jabiensis]MBB5773682.1 hypothetical protein [Nonomuraea jabiensis]
MVLINVQIHFYGLTFEELYKFVNAARATGVDPSSEVPLVECEDDYERVTTVTGSQLALNDRTFKGFPEPLSADEAQQLSTVLDRLLTAEDPQKLRSDVLLWRDRLREAWHLTAAI